MTTPEQTPGRGALDRPASDPAAALSRARRTLVGLIPTRTRRVLDVACGAGETAALVREAVPGCTITGVETDTGAAARARAHCDQVVSDPRGVECYPAGSADVVVAVGVLEFLDDPVAFVRDVGTYLADDGELLVATAVGRDVPALLAAAEPWSVPTLDPDTGRRFSRRRLAAVFAAAGYELTALRLVPDPSVPALAQPGDQRPLRFRCGPLTLENLDADDVEELAATYAVVAARRIVPGADRPAVSIVVPLADDASSDDYDLTGLTGGIGSVRCEILVVAPEAGDETAGPTLDAPPVRVLRAPRPLPAVEACNLAARHARGEVVVFMDRHDRSDGPWLEPLLDGLRRDPGFAAAGGVILGTAGRVEEAGLEFGTGDVPFHSLPMPGFHGADVAALPQDGGVSVPAVGLRGMAVRRDLFVLVGGFDETLDGSLAAADLCRRLRARGKRIVLCPAARFAREDGDSMVSGEAPERRIRFLEKWDGVHIDPPQRPAAVACIPGGGAGSDTTRTVVWSGPLTHVGGYGEEARSFVFALDRAGVAVHANPIDHRVRDGVRGTAADSRLRRLVTTHAPDGFIHIIHMQPAGAARDPESGRLRIHESFRRHPRAARHIGRTMFETDRIPDAWVDPCNRMDEIWVPATFNVETFARAGVDREKLVTIPSPLPAEFYDDEIAPASIPHVSGFVFLSVFGWGRRKGWDALLRAYVEEFAATEDVTLVCKILPSFGLTVRDHQAEMEFFLADELGRDPRKVPRIVVLAANASRHEMAALYRAADAFVIPTRGEGWGRPYMEAMAARLPVIATRWSGHLDFMNDENSYLLDCSVLETPESLCRENSIFRGHHCAEPSVPHLRRLMRHVSTHREEGTARGRRARDDVVPRYTEDAVARMVAERLPASPRFGYRRAPALAVNWEGPQFVHFGMAAVNRELCLELIDSRRVDLKLLCDDGTSGNAAADARFAPLLRRRGAHPADRVAVHVRHQWPPCFDPPAGGRWVLIQPWEFGSPPRDWIEPMNRTIDEVWVPSAHVRDCYVRGGVDPARIAVVPNGVDTARFHPGVPPLVLPARGTFRFLFVGGTIARKGIDILIETYIRTFRPDDDVCLVVKDLGTDTFYRNQNLRERILALAADHRNPEILYIGEDLPGERLAGLYTACHCLVHPYRGEGFGLPIAEAMACGLPVIVPNRGPAVEICDRETALFVPAREHRLPEPRVGDLVTVDSPVFAEVDADALAAAMRRVRDQPEEAAARGRRGRERACRELSWARAAERVLERLEAVAAQPIRRSHVTAVLDGAGPRLSACILARNEERLLARAIRSVRDVADEIVVLDTGSTDRTVEIAREHDARVFFHPWEDDWAAARNVLLEHARYEWVLMLDADQTLEPASRNELRRLIRRGGLIGYLLLERSYMDEQGTSIVDNRSLRLFPRHRDIRYTGRIHEQVVGHGSAATMGRIACDVVLHHDGYRPGFGDPHRKAGRDLPILESLVVEEPANGFHWYNLGVTLHVLERHAEAEQALRRCIAVADESPGAAAFYAVNANVVLALACLGQNRPDPAVAACEAALALAPRCADAHCTRAAAEMRRGHLDTALDAYRSALDSAGEPLLQGMRDRSAASWKPLLGIGEIYLMQDRPAEAVESFERAGGLHRDHGPILTGLAQAYRRSGRIDRAESVLRQALEVENGEPVASLLLADVLLDRGKADLAEEILLRAADRHPDDFRCARALDRVQRLRGREAAADRRLRELRAQNRDSPLPLLLEAGRHIEGERFEDALQCLSDALALDDSNADTFIELGALLLRLDRWDEAAHAYRVAVHLRPLDDGARRGLVAARQAS